MSKKTVFISYSHDTTAHSKRVLELANVLRSQGVDVELDQYHVRPPQGWPQWCEEQLRPDKAAFVLVICTDIYRQRVEGRMPADEGRGVFWEGGIIYSYLYNEKGNKRFIPVLLPGAKEEDIPRPLHDDTRYHPKAFDLNDAGYLALYRELTGQPAVIKPAVGQVVALPPDGQSVVNPLNPLPARQVLSRFIPADISRIDKYAPADLIGREAETKLLTDAWDQAVRGEPKRPHVLTFVALGGEGKTSLVAKWAADLAHEGWPGCDAAFAWPFYSQGTRERTAASSDAFLAEALTFFGDAAMAGSARGAFDKGRRLARLVGERRALLILDGVEPLQYPPRPPMDGKLKDDGIIELLKGLAATSLGLCVVTTRYAIPDLRAYWQTTAPVHELPRLSTAAGVKLLRTIGVRTGSRADFEKLVEDVDGHALTLQILGQFLVRAFHGDIRRRDRISFEKADAKIQGGHAFRAMEAYVKWMEDDSEEACREVALLKLLGLFDRPATADCLAALRRAPAIPGLTEPLVGLAEDDWEFSLSALRDAKLLTVNREEGSGVLVALDAHPLLREYFGTRLRRQQPEAWRAAHRRLYEHLCSTTKEGDQPTLEDLQPLCQAVGHGCKAGLYRDAFEVFLQRICHGDHRHFREQFGAYSSNVALQASFFAAQWKLVEPTLDLSRAAIIFVETGGSLLAVTRLAEAEEALDAGLKLLGTNLADENTVKYASRLAVDLSKVRVVRGDLESAVTVGEKSVQLADLTSDTSFRVPARTTLANALHQTGRLSDAEVFFKEAEEMGPRRGPSNPWMHELRGYYYCELLLSLGQSETVRDRATWVIERNCGNALSAALHRLCLARTYSADEEKAQENAEMAISELRQNGAMDFLPAGLMVRASLRFANDRIAEARSDLDEAWEIAERGPMKLHMADIHLHRARLFFREAEYPWGSPAADLAAARELIEKCGYGRRKEELEDAERAIGGGGA